MTTRLFLIALYTIVGIFLLFLPELTRGRRLFGVPLESDARGSVLARRAFSGYRTAVFTISLLVVVLCLLSPVEVLRKAQSFLFLPMALSAVVAFNWAHLKLRPLAQIDQSHHRRSVELSAEPDQTRWIALLGSLPIVLLSVIAVTLYIYWERIPHRVAVHFGTNGPDRWLDRSTLVVYGPVLIGLEIFVWLLLLAFIAWSGMRRSRGRWLFVGLMLWLEHLLGSMFSLVSLSPIVPAISQVWIPALLVGTWIIVGIAALRRLQKKEEAVESTPDQCWKAGLFYFNRNDPALLVEVREGNNFMLNFANPMSWGVLIGTVSVATVVIIQTRWFFS